MTTTPAALSDVHAWVSEYYGKLLASSDDLKTNACCASGAPPTWIAGALSRVHPDVSARFYGCGFPIPQAVKGARVLDLGCGTGRDVYVLSQLVGSCGKVVGVDMTDEQLDVARATETWHAEQFGYSKPNTSFVKVFIEDLSAIEDGTMDLIVSNCVVNLSPRKDLVLAEAFRVLKPGGEFYFSDVFVDRRLPAHIASDPVLYGECLGGAMYEFDFLTLARRLGFADPRVMTTSPVTIQNADVSAKVGAAQFRSTTLRLFKLPALDAQCEDYGQLAIYKGGIAGADTVYWLDDQHAFEVGRPERVCGNTAAMLSQTRLARYFEVVGDTSTHFGVFPCGPTLAATQYASATVGSSAGTTSCC